MKKYLGNKLELGVDLVLASSDEDMGKTLKKDLIENDYLKSCRGFNEVIRGKNCCWYTCLNKAATVIVDYSSNTVRIDARNRGELGQAESFLREICIENDTPLTEINSDVNARRMENPTMPYGDWFDIDGNPYPA